MSATVNFVLQSGVGVEGVEPACCMSVVHGLVMDGPDACSMIGLGAVMQTVCVVIGPDMASVSGGDGATYEAANGSTKTGEVCCLWSGTTLPGLGNDPVCMSGTVVNLLECLSGQSSQGAMYCSDSGTANGIHPDQMSLPGADVVTVSDMTECCQCMGVYGMCSPTVLGTDAACYQSCLRFYCACPDGGVEQDGDLSTPVAQAGFMHGGGPRTRFEVDLEDGSSDARPLYGLFLMVVVSVTSVCVWAGCYMGLCHSGPWQVLSTATDPVGEFFRQVDGECACGLYPETGAVYCVSEATCFIRQPRFTLGTSATSGSQSWSRRPRHDNVMAGRPIRPCVVQNRTPPKCSLKCGCFAGVWSGCEVGVGSVCLLPSCTCVCERRCYTMHIERASDESKVCHFEQIEPTQVVIETSNISQFVTDVYFEHEQVVSSECPAEFECATTPCALRADDVGKAQANCGHCAEPNLVTGLHKGGSCPNFIAMSGTSKPSGSEQTSKNLSIMSFTGGGKGGLDPDFKGKLNNETTYPRQLPTIESRCYTGFNIDALVGDSGAGGCEAGHTPGQHKCTCDERIGASMGKGSLPGGLSVCIEVIGHGSVHPADEHSKNNGDLPEGKNAAAYGLGNAVTHVAQKALQSGGKASVRLDIYGRAEDFEGTDHIASEYAHNKKCLGNDCGAMSVTHADECFGVMRYEGDGCGARQSLRDTVSFRVCENISYSEDVKVSAVNGAKVAGEGVNTFIITEVMEHPQEYGAVPTFGKVVNVGGASALGSETSQNVEYSLRMPEEADGKSEQSTCGTPYNAVDMVKEHGYEGNPATGVNTVGPSKAVDVTTVQGARQLWY